MHCSMAGLGDIDAMRTLSTTVGVSDLISCLGLLNNTEVFSRMAAADLVVVPSPPNILRDFLSRCLKPSHPALPSSVATIQCSGML